MTAEYVAQLVSAHPQIREVWLYGSRANGTATHKSDWDYLAFADDRTLAELQLDTPFHRGDIDLMIVTDGVRFAKPCVDEGESQKVGTLAAEFGGLHWRKISATEATYRATKPIDGPGFRTRVFEQRAVSVYPATVPVLTLPPVNDTRDELLLETLGCLMAHRHHEWGDRTPVDVFNRLLAKNIKPEGHTASTHLDIQLRQICSRREWWRGSEFKKLVRGHSEPLPFDLDDPIIIVEYQGEVRLLDGNHRINRWLATGDQRPHDVNIHTVDGVGQFVELPPVR